LCVTISPIGPIGLIGPIYFSSTHRARNPIWKGYTVMRQNDSLVPFIAIHPGETLKEELEARGWTQSYLAEKIGRPVQLINMIVNERKGISEDTALDFSEAFGTSAEFWMNLDVQYRLTLARQRRMKKAG